MVDLELSDKTFQKFVDLVYKHSRISLSERKRTLVKTRFGKVMRGLGIDTYEEYYDYIVSDKSGSAITDMINAISTNLTKFFREDKHFEFLAKEYLRPLIQEKSQVRNRRIRVWSAGCSTGEEPYTISIVLRENIPDVDKWDVKVLATDIDSNVLEHGKRGVYKKEQVKDIPTMLMTKYFTRAGDRRNPEYHVSPMLKKIIAFRSLNLMRADYPFKGPFDIIFCRNVMIYFDKETQQSLVSRFYNLLEPGGVLMIGHSESLTGIKTEFKYVRPTIYLK